jgi:hypothetical protein
VGEFYVYVHLRADSGLPFYVGKGRNGRAYDRKSRNKYWHAVARKSGVVVEFLHTGLTEEEAFSKEIEEIAWFRGYYTLANMTDGGDGSTKSEQLQDNKRAILEFVLRHGRTPRRRSPDERPLWTKMSNYCSPAMAMYDADFHAEVMKLGYKENEAPKKKERIKTFIETHKRSPSKYKDDERHMSRWLSDYCSPASSSYDPEFHAWARSVGYGARRRRKSTSP